jgi:hypothetical protein
MRERFEFYPAADARRALMPAERFDEAVLGVDEAASAILRLTVNPTKPDVVTLLRDRERELHDAIDAMEKERGAGR